MAGGSKPISSLYSIKRRKKIRSIQTILAFPGELWFIYQSHTSTQSLKLVLNPTFCQIYCLSNIFFDILNIFYVFRFEAVFQPSKRWVKSKIATFLAIIFIDSLAVVMISPYSYHLQVEYHLKGKHLSFHKSFWTILSKTKEKLP